MARAEAILSSVRRIHDASLTADAWQGALQSVTELLGGEHAVLLASDHARPSASLAVCVGMDRRDVARFASPEAAGLIEPVMRTVRPGDVVTRSRLIDDRQFERSEFYNGLVRPIGGYHAIAVTHRMPTLFSFLTICRPRRAVDFDTDGVSIMQTLSPHFDTALRVRQRLGAVDLAAEGAWTALEKLESGAMLVDTNGIVFANRAIERLLGARKLGLEGLYAGDTSASRTLRRLMAACTASAEADDDAGGTVEFASETRQAGLRVVVSRFRPERAGIDMPQYARALALLLVNDPLQERRDRAATLQRRFNLTPAEAEFALHIVKGDGRAAAAARLNISVGTARTHLERIFEKTGVRRQAELVHLLLSET